VNDFVVLAAPPCDMPFLERQGLFSKISEHTKSNGSIIVVEKMGSPSSFRHVTSAVRTAFVYEHDTDCDKVAVKTTPAIDNTVDIDDKCKICGEFFKIEWDTGCLEWLLMNAIRVGNDVFHPSCFENMRVGEQRQKPQQTGRNEAKKETKVTKEAKEVLLAKVYSKHKMQKFTPF
jgi:hypothetical protein